jgi:hypothetical protein
MATRKEPNKSLISEREPVKQESSVPLKGKRLLSGKEETHPFSAKRDLIQGTGFGLC